MKIRLMLVLVVCAISLGAQSVSTRQVTFSISNPGHVLTVTKTDPRAIEMFTVDFVDAKGNPKGTYVGIVEGRIAPIMTESKKEFRLTFFPWYWYGVVVHVRDSKVYFFGDDNPIVNQRNADLTAGRTFNLWRIIPPDRAP